MKKIISLILVLMMILSLFAGCGSDRDNGKDLLGDIREEKDDSERDNSWRGEEQEKESEPEPEQEVVMETVYLLSRIETPGLSLETFTYDENGFILESTMFNMAGEEIDYCSYEVDKRGCPVSAEGRYDGMSYGWEFEYDKKGNILKRAYIEGNEETYRVEYIYDKEGKRLEEKEFWSGGHTSVIRYTYDEYGDIMNGKEYSTYDNSVKSEMYYDRNGHLVRDYTYETELESDADRNFVYDDNGCLIQENTYFSGAMGYTAYYEYKTIQVDSKQAEILRKVQKDLLRMYY